jgi:hypothetical protein
MRLTGKLPYGRQHSRDPVEERVTCTSQERPGGSDSRCRILSSLAFVEHIGVGFVPRMPFLQSPSSRTGLVVRSERTCSFTGIVQTRSES